MLCYRGCGREVVYYTNKGLGCCDPHPSNCPAVAEKKRNAQKGKPKPSVSRALKGRKFDDARRSKQADVIKKQWDEGKRGSEESRKKSSESNKKSWQDNPRTPWNKGLTGAQVPWNKGFRKTEPMEILSREDPAYRDFKKYRHRVGSRTKKVYNQFKDELNPNNHPIGRSGVDGAYQVDHIVSVREGFERGISIEDMSAKENLQVIPWLENIKKYGGSSRTI